MTLVTVSLKYQLVIPKEICESMGITSGQIIEIFSYKNRIELVPIKPIKELKGILKGIDTNINREKDRI